jgi:hypothetical protein
MLCRGAFHAHSSYSYDGKDSLERLVAALLGRGFQFLLLTEHDDKLRAQDYETIIAESRRLSSAKFLVIPGIEVRCWRREKEQWHIAAVGVRRWIARGSISEVVAEIHAVGGLAVLLHPFKYTADIAPEDLDSFDGLEIWNGKFDGFYGPRSSTLRLARRLRSRSRRPRLYCGHDLHGVDGIAPLALQMELSTLEEKEVMQRLRQGEFALEGAGSVFGAAGGPNAVQRFRMGLRRAAYESYRRCRRLPLLGGVLAAGKKLLGRGKVADGG